MVGAVGRGAQRHFLPTARAWGWGTAAPRPRGLGRGVPPGGVSDCSRPREVRWPGAPRRPGVASLLLSESLALPGAVTTRGSPGTRRATSPGGLLTPVETRGTRWWEKGRGVAEEGAGRRRGNVGGRVGAVWGPFGEGRKGIHTRGRMFAERGRPGGLLGRGGA